MTELASIAGASSAEPAAIRPGAARLRGLARLGLGLVLPLALALAWEGAARSGLISTHLMPPPSAVLRHLVELVASGEIWTHLQATLTRMALGFGFGVAAGTLLGAVVGYLPLAHRLLDPSVQALRNIPSIAWVPLFILWLGIFETSKVTLIAVGVFFPVYMSLASGFASVDRKLVEVGRVWRLSPVAMIWRILLPATLPTYIIGLRGGLGLGWMFVVAAELMGASEGLGYLMVDGQMTGRPAAILASLVLFAVLGKASDLLLVQSTRPLVAWQDGFRQ
jgi:sulfonate transport system permease protein